jgi:hypothetical protein
VKCSDRRRRKSGTARAECVLPLIPHVLSLTRTAPRRLLFVLLQLLKYHVIGGLSLEKSDFKDFQLHVHRPASLASGTRVFSVSN